MDSLDQLDLNDLISSESYTYSVSNIEDKRDNYTPGNTVQISFPPGNYIKDCRQDYLIFDSVVSGTNAVAGAFYPRQIEDYFQINNIEVNGVQILQSMMSQGKNLFTNWLKNSLTPYKPEQQMLPLTGLFNSKGSGAIVNYSGAVDSSGQNAPLVAQTRAQVLSYEPTHLVYQGQTASGGGASAAANVSHILAYNQSQLSAAKYRQKQYNMSVNIETGVVSSSAPGIPNEFSANMIRLGDICPEYDSLGLVNMCATSIRMTIRFNDVNRVLTSGAHGGPLATANRGILVLTDETYSLSNLCLYYKTMQIKPNLISQAKMMLNKSRPILTVYQNIKPLEGTVTNQRISVNTSNLYYVVVFLQPNQNSKNVAKAADPFQINYSANNATVNDAANFLDNFNNLRYGTYEDTLEFKHNQLIVDIGGKQFKQQIIPVGDRDKKSWLDCMNSVYQCTGQYLNITLNQFLNNRFFAIIPLSPNQFPDTVYQDGAITLNVMLDLSQNDRRVALATSMQMVTFVVGSKILINGERLE